MRFLSKEVVVENLNLIVEKSRIVMERSREIMTYHDFLVTPARVEKFDAACMLVQVIGELARKIDNGTSSLLFVHYPQVYWRGVFGLRNIISHEYCNIDPESVFKVIKKYLPELEACVEGILKDIEEGKHDALFGENR